MPDTVHEIGHNNLYSNPVESGVYYLTLNMRETEAQIDTARKAGNPAPESVCLKEYASLPPSKLIYIEYVLCTRNDARLITCIIALQRGRCDYHTHFQMGKLRCSLPEVAHKASP